MGTAPAGISEADWLATPSAVRSFILGQQQEIEQLRLQLTVLARELAQLRERIGRSSRNSSKPPSSDGPGFKSLLKNSVSPLAAASDAASTPVVIRDLAGNSSVVPRVRRDFSANS